MQNLIAATGWFFKNNPLLLKNHFCDFQIAESRSPRRIAFFAFLESIPHFCSLEEKSVLINKRSGAECPTCEKFLVILHP